MKLESAVAKVRRMRITTSIIVALALIMMGVISTRVSDSTRDGMFWLAMILMILSVVIPVSYTAYLAKKGPDLPTEDDEKE